MMTPTESKMTLPQGGIIRTDGPFRLSGTSAKEAHFELIDDPSWGTLNLTLEGLYERCKWTRKYLQKARGNMQYFLHTVQEENRTYEALTCWSPGRFTRLETTPLLREIIKNEGIIQLPRTPFFEKYEKEIKEYLKGG
jgi:hypothetical protein